MVNMVEIVCQEVRQHEGNDCLIKDAYIILGWRDSLGCGIYMYMHIHKYEGNWIDESKKIEYCEAREFKSEDKARKYMELRIAEDY